MSNQETPHDGDGKTETTQPTVKLSKDAPQWLNESMRLGVTTDFFLLCVLIVFHTKQYFLPESEALWPINQAYVLHRALMIVNSLLSVWKGWSVDGSSFYAFHHAITGWFFYYTTSSSTSSLSTYKYLIGMVVYTIMRIFKRLKDKGVITRCNSG